MKIGRAIATVLMMGIFMMNAVGAKGAPASNADVEPSKWATLQKIAVALGFKSWTDDGFWQAYQAAVAQEAERIEQERLAGANAIIDDAMLYGRRVESPPVEVNDSLTRVDFIEYVLPPDGDPAGAFARIGTDWIVHGLFGDTIVRITRYFVPGQLSPAAQVQSLIEDGTETVTAVTQFEPGAVDLHPGDEFPAPTPSTGKAGQRPQTLDPKSDGSMGRASPSTQSNSGSSSGTGGASNPGGDPAGDPGTSGSASDSGSDAQPADSRPEDNGEWSFKGSSSYLDSDGTTTNVTGYDNSDGRTLWVTTTTDADGNSTTGRTCYKDSEEVSCEGRTEDPTCSSASCQQLVAVFSILGASEVSFVEKIGTPIDYGDTTVSAPQKEQVGGYPWQDPRVTDPANPGESEATIITIQREMSGSLLNTGNPLDPNASQAPAPSRFPTTGDTQRLSGFRW